MGAGWYRARRELRRRWRGTLLLVLLVGLAGGAVLTAVAGARRSSTAYERFREETLASDLDAAFAEEAPEGDIDAAADAVRELPGVAAVARNDFPFIVPSGSGFYPYLDFLAALSDEPLTEADVDVPRVIEGRLPDPEDPNQVAITERYAEDAGLAAGDMVEFESYAWPQLEALFTTGDAGPPAGPRLTLEVTGVVAAPTFLSESSGDFQPSVFLTPAFGEEHGDGVATYEGGFVVRLEEGTDVESFTETLRATFPDHPMEITPATEVDRKIETGVDVVVTALALTALVAGLSGTVAVAQALARHFTVQDVSDRWLTALGMTRRERVASNVATVLPAAVLGAASAVVIGVLGSTLMPVGLARRAEPHPGVDLDVAVLLVGALVILVLGVVLAVLVAAVVSRRARVAATAERAPAPSSAMSAVRRTNLAPSVTTGVGMVLEPRGGTSFAVRSGLLAVTFGVAGLVAVVVFIASLGALVRSPARYGAPFDADVSGFSGDVLGADGDDLVARSDIARVGLGRSGLGHLGGEEVNTYTFESLKGDMSFTLLDGHAPAGGAEVALGATTLEQSGVSIGEEVVVEGAEGSLRATVVGTAVFPIIDERSSPSRGVLLSPDDFERISSFDEPSADVLIDWTDDVDVAEANAALAEETGTEVFEPRLPSDVNNLREVESLPKALAAFLAVLAALAVLHALASTVRLRRQELAVLRTLGFERRQLAATLVWQASTLGILGLVAGVPVGLVVGRLVWRSVAGGIGVVDDPVNPPLALGVVVASALVVVNLAAMLPSRTARRVVATAGVLRAG